MKTIYLLNRYDDELGRSVECATTTYEKAVILLKMIHAQMAGDGWQCKLYADDVLRCKAGYKIVEYSISSTELQ